MRLAAVLLLTALCLAAPARALAQADEAGEEAPPAAPAPQVPPIPPQGPPPRDAHLDRLEDAVVHFEFQRAPLEDVLEALERGAKVPARLGRRAKAALEKRRFRIKYVASRKGVQVLDDLAKAAALDWEVTDEGAVLDLPQEVRKLRAKLGLPARRLRLTPEDVAKMLETKRLSLAARERPLSAVLAFLRRETGVRFVRLSGEEGAGEGAEPPPEPKVTLSVTDTPLGELLDQVLAGSGQAWLRQGNVIVVADAAEVERLRAAAKQDAGG